MAMRGESDFPLNYRTRFRPVARDWLGHQLEVFSSAQGEAARRERMRVALVTQTVGQAEAYAQDLIALLKGRVEACVGVYITPSEGWCWQYEARVYSGMPGSKVDVALTSEHLCRILFRLAQARVRVELVGWPADWPKVPVLESAV